MLAKTIISRIERGINICRCAKNKVEVYPFSPGNSLPYGNPVWWRYVSYNNYFNNRTHLIGTSLKTTIL
jgi:hypothetical protein